MARKGKKRREERRRKRRDVEEGPPPVAESPVAEDAGERPAPAAASRRRVQRTKRRPQKAGHIALGPLEVPVRALVGWGSVAVAVGGFALVGFLIATSGSSGVTAPQVTASPDPRVSGLTPTTTLQLEAGGSDVDAYFNPTTLTAPAGEAVEIIIENTGSLSHNVTISGVDKEYDTSDDWVSQPTLIAPGEEGRLVFKIDEAGTYPFRCSLHPQVQFGDLVLQ